MIISSVSTLRLIPLLITASLCIGGRFAAAETGNPAADRPDNTYSVSFFCLKQHSAIGPSSITLHDNGTLHLVIDNEDLTDTDGTYTIKNSTFEAAYSFSVKRRGRQIQYTLDLSGIALFSAYIAGKAVLTEYTAQKAITQKIPFVFLASRKKTQENGQPSLFPF